MHNHSSNQTNFSLFYNFLFLESKVVPLHKDYDISSKYSELFDLPDFVNNNNQSIFAADAIEAVSSNQMSPNWFVTAPLSSRVYDPWYILNDKSTHSNMNRRYEKI
jgi:hypothetical protein